MKTLVLFLVFTCICNYHHAQNRSLHFDGVDDVVLGPSNALLEISNGTVELWIKPETKATSQTFLCYRDSTGLQTRYLWNILGNLSGLGFWNGGGYTTIDYTFNSGAWYHLAFVGKSTSTEIYINGNKIGVFSQSLGTATGGDLQLVLGHDIPLSEYYQGEMDEVRIWDRPLCKEEIVANKSCNLEGTEAGLIAYYNFNQGDAGSQNTDSTVLIDRTANGLNGLLTNFTLDGNNSNWLLSGNGVNDTCSMIICPPPPPSHVVEIYYLITSDYSFVKAEYDEIKRAIKEIQGWYQAATGGSTFYIINKDTPIVVNLPNTSIYYHDTSDIFNTDKLNTDMAGLGYVPLLSGKISFYFIKGGGRVGLGNQSCGSDCGIVWFGMDIYKEFDTGQFGPCPVAPGGVASFPCTPLGAATHELGHAFGLPHPVDFPVTNIDANHSVMQTHWNYPWNFATLSESPWGLLTLQRQTLLSNPFFYDSIFLNQLHEDLPIVNLPNTGTIPTAAFTHNINDQTVTFNNLSTDHESSYWTFGNSDVSHEVSPAYTYPEDGIYTVRLRTRNSNGMMAIQSTTIVIGNSFNVVAKAVLGGAYFPAGDSMGTSLRTQNLISSKCPYDTTIVLTTIPVNMVDWVQINLVDTITGDTTYSSQCACLLKNASLQNPDGDTAFTFSLESIPFYSLRIKHRNHLSVRSKGLPVVPGSLQTFDFRTGNNLYMDPTISGNAYHNISLPEVLILSGGAHPSRYALWPGDANGDGQVKYQGSGNDRALILAAIGGTVITNTLSGYELSDISLNGQVKYQGSGNDRALILSSIGGTNITKISKAHN